eukprot:gene2711-5336_t
MNVIRWLQPGSIVSFVKISKLHYEICKSCKIPLISMKRVYCGGSINLLQWTIEAKTPRFKLFVGPRRLCWSSISSAVESTKMAQISKSVNSLGCLDMCICCPCRWIRSQDPPCPWNEQTCAYYASCERHLDALKWLSQDPPCPWNINNCINKARNNSKQIILEWMMTQR